MSFGTGGPEGHLARGENIPPAALPAIYKTIRRGTMMENSFLESEKKYVERLLTTTVREIELLTGRSNKEIMKFVTRFNQIGNQKQSERPPCGKFTGNHLLFGGPPRLLKVRS